MALAWPQAKRASGLERGGLPPLEHLREDYKIVDIGAMVSYCMGMVIDRFEEEEQEERTNEGEERGDAISERMLESRSILLSGEVDKTLAERIIRQLILMEQMSDKSVRIFIDSPGGDAHAGYAIFDMIRFIKPPVYTIGMGLVASMGAIVLLAAKRERRFGFPNSRYLIHQPLSGMQGVATDIEIHATEIEKIRTNINRLIASETGKKIATVERDTDRDFWMSPKEALKYNLISKIISKSGDLSDLDA